MSCDRLSRLGSLLSSRKPSDVSMDEKRFSNQWISWFGVFNGSSVTFASHYSPFHLYISLNFQFSFFISLLDRRRNFLQDQENNQNGQGFRNLRPTKRSSIQLPSFPFGWRAYRTRSNASQVGFGRSRSNRLHARTIWRLVDNCTGEKRILDSATTRTIGERMRMALRCLCSINISYRKEHEKWIYFY